MPRWRAKATFLKDGAALQEDLAEDLWRSFSRPEVRAFVVRMCAGYQGELPRLPELYEKIACPMLALWGEADRHFPPAQAQGLHEIRRRGADAIQPPPPPARYSVDDATGA